MVILTGKLIARCISVNDANNITTAYFASVNRAGQALKDLQESCFKGLSSNIKNFTESIHPDNSGGTLSDLEFNYFINFVQPTNPEKLNQAFSIIANHGGKIDK